MGILDTLGDISLPVSGMNGHIRHFGRHLLTCRWNAWAYFNEIVTITHYVHMSLT